MDMKIMDEEFKFWYVTCIFQDSDYLDPCWKQQVMLLQDQWDELAQMIDKNDFYRSFSKSCAELNQPAREYALEEAFGKAKKEWKIELMLRVAHEIVYHYDDDVPEGCRNLENCKDPLVFMENGYIKVNTSLCPSFHV